MKFGFVCFSMLLTFNSFASSIAQYDGKGKSCSSKVAENFSTIFDLFKKFGNYYKNIDVKKNDFYKSGFEKLIFSVYNKKSGYSNAKCWEDVCSDAQVKQLVDAQEKLILILRIIFLTYDEFEISFNYKDAEFFPTPRLISFINSLNKVIEIALKHYLDGNRASFHRELISNPDLSANFKVVQAELAQMKPKLLGLFFSSDLFQLDKDKELILMSMDLGALCVGFFWSFIVSDEDLVSELGTCRIHLIGRVLEELNTRLSLSLPELPGSDL